MIISSAEHRVFRTLSYIWKIYLRSRSKISGTYNFVKTEHLFPSWFNHTLMFYVSGEREREREREREKIFISDVFVCVCVHDTQQ